MSSTTQVKDFSDLYTDLLNRIRADTSETATVAQAKRYINIALQDIFIGFGEEFPWAERSAVLTTNPQYTTGTVTVTVGSTTVTGSSTAWNTANDYGINNARAGGKMTFGGTDVYEVSSVDSDTQITLSTAFIGSTDSGVSYSYFEDEYALHADFLRPLDLQTFSDAADIKLIGRKEFRRSFPRNHIVGSPAVATILDKPFSGDTTPVRKVRFWRPPSNARLIPYTFITNKLVTDSSGTAQQSFSADADEPILPFGYRHVIVLKALSNWYRDKKDDTRSLEVQGEFEQLLARIVGDQEIGANRPRLQPRISPHAMRARRPWSGARGRYVTGSRFDEIR